MKSRVVLLTLLLTLAGCTGMSDELDEAMELRANLLNSTGCSFDAEVTADYADAVYTFSMHCEGDNQGKLTFTVTAPESIAGVAGVISAGSGTLTFDDAALEFPLQADNQVTPVSGPWIFLKTLLGGYMTSCGEEDGLLRLTIRDSYEEEALTLDIWLDANADSVPVCSEILFDGRRIVTMEIENFQIA